MWHRFGVLEPSEWQREARLPYSEGMENAATTQEPSTMTATYECPDCRNISTHADPDDACCENPASLGGSCGLLYAEHRLPTAPHKSRVRFELDGSPLDYYPGEDRPYRVLIAGCERGWVEASERPSANGDGTFVREFAASIDGVGIGQGSTRYAAVAACFA